MLEQESIRNVAVLKMKHGKVNAMDLEFCQGLAAKFEELGAAGPAAVVITGTGSVFSAGVDLYRVLSGGDDYLDRFLPALSRMVRTVFLFPRPVVAAVNGHAIAGGCILAAAADHRILAEGVAGMGVPELKVGVPFPGAALEVLRHAAGPRVTELALFGETHRGSHAVERGLADEIAASPNVLPRAVEVAEALAAIPRETFEITKRQLRHSALRRMAWHERETDHRVTRSWKDPRVQEVIRSYMDGLKKRAGE
jgi:enoyl-CoA hydratase